MMDDDQSLFLKFENSLRIKLESTAVLEMMMLLRGGGHIYTLWSCWSWFRNEFFNQVSRFPRRAFGSKHMKIS